MTMRIDQVRAAAWRILPDFERLHVGRHPIDPRAAASIVIACMTLSLVLMVTLTLTPPVRRAPAKSAEQVAPPPAAGKVTIIAASPRLDLPCAEQTWPYFDRRCLTETTQKRPQPQKAGGRTVTASTPVDAQKTSAETAKPAAATAVTSPPAGDTQQAAAPRDVQARAEAPAPQQPLSFDTSEDAELAEDDEIPHPLPVLSERELRQLERMERRRAAQERRMRSYPLPHFPIFGRIF